MTSPITKRGRYSPDVAVNRQRQDQQSIQRLLEAGIANGRALETTTSTAGWEVKHGLGRIPVGFIVIDRRFNVEVWIDADSTATTLYLDASHNGHPIKLWVF